MRRNIALTPEMRALLLQVVNKQGRGVTEADVIRDAIRHYLDEQADLIGSCTAGQAPAGHCAAAHHGPGGGGV